MSISLGFEIQMVPETHRHDCDWKLDGTFVSKITITDSMLNSKVVSEEGMLLIQ